MVNLKILHVASLAYMPSFVSFKLNCSGTVLCSNFLGGNAHLYWSNTLILAKCLYFVAALYDSSFSEFGLFACNTQVMLVWSEYCSFRALV